MPAVTTAGPNDSLNDTVPAGALAARLPRSAPSRPKPRLSAQPARHAPPAAGSSRQAPRSHRAQPPGPRSPSPDSPRARHSDARPRASRAPDRSRRAALRRAGCRARQSSALPAVTDWFGTACLKSIPRPSEKPFRSMSTAGASEDAWITLSWAVAASGSGSLSEPQAASAAARHRAIMARIGCFILESPWGRWVGAGSSARRAVLARPVCRVGGSLVATASAIRHGPGRLDSANDQPMSALTQRGQ